VSSVIIININTAPHSLFSINKTPVKRTASFIMGGVGFGTDF
jgi:hypothetical protein